MCIDIIEPAECKYYPYRNGILFIFSYNISSPVIGSTKQITDPLGYKTSGILYFIYNEKFIDLGDKNRYLNKTYGFSIDYPKSWIEEVPDRNITILKLASPEYHPKSEYNFMNAEIVVKIYLGESSIPDHEKKLRKIADDQHKFISEIIDKSKGNIKDIKLTKTRISNIEVYEMSFYEKSEQLNKLTNKIDTLGSDVLQLLFIRDGFQIGFTFISLDQDTLARNFKEIMKSQSYDRLPEAQKQFFNQFHSRGRELFNKYIGEAREIFSSIQFL